MKIILAPALGVNYYPEGDIVVKRCLHIKLDMVQVTDARRYLTENRHSDDIGPITPQRFRKALEWIQNRHEDEHDFYVLDKDIENCFVMPAPLYCQEAKFLKRVWIPESWKTIESPNDK